MKRLSILALGVLVSGSALASATAPVAQPAQTPASVKEFTMDEVAKHATKDDCWFVVNGNVHNVTAIIPKHGGGEKPILKNCGKDATKPFETQGGKGKHSAKAHEYLAGTKIGVLKK
jgi:cytochrome b involved in lipid metabolism